MVTIHSPGCLARARVRQCGPGCRGSSERVRATGNTLRKASRSMCAWPSVMPGMTALPLRSMTRVAGPAMAAIAASGPTATIRSPAMAIACAIVKAASTVMILPFLRMRSAGLVPARAGMPQRRLRGTRYPGERRTARRRRQRHPPLSKADGASSPPRPSPQEKSAIECGGLSYFLPKYVLISSR